MSRVIAFLVGLAIVGGGIVAVVYKNKGSHPELKGSILKVRSLADGDGAIVFLDFRVTNTAAIPFVVNSVQMTMETLDSEVANAVMFSKSDVDKVTKYLKLLGPKYNDVLSIQDKLPPVETVDRMAAGRFNFPPRFLNPRKTIHLRITEADGVVSEIVETSESPSKSNPAK